MGENKRRWWREKHFTIVEEKLSLGDKPRLLLLKRWLLNDLPRLCFLITVVVGYFISCGTYNPSGTPKLTHFISSASRLSLYLSSRLSYSLEHSIYNMDRSWMNARRTSREYIDGVEAFIEFAKRNDPNDKGMYYCPCVKCLNDCRLSVDDIRDHLICDGIHSNYQRWMWHGEEGSSSESDEDNGEGNDVDEDRLEEMIHDIEAESTG